MCQYIGLEMCDRHFADGIFEFVFFFDNFCSSNQFSLKFLLKNSINSKPVQTIRHDMMQRWPSLLTHVWSLILEGSFRKYCFTVFLFLNVLAKVTVISWILPRNKTRVGVLFLKFWHSSSQSRLNCRLKDEILLYPLWSNDVLWWPRSGSTLAEELTTPSNYLNPCWLIVSKVNHWPSAEEDSFTRDTLIIKHEIFLIITFMQIS